MLQHRRRVAGLFDDHVLVEEQLAVFVVVRSFLDGQQDRLAEAEVANEPSIYCWTYFFMSKCSLISYLVTRTRVLVCTYYKII